MKQLICTITPNPALDLGGTVAAIVANEKNYVRDVQRAPGGNALNAARILHRLGYPDVASGFLGGGVGSELEALVAKEKLRHHFIKIQEPTRVNVTVSEQASHHQTRLSFPGPKISGDEKEKLFQYVTNLKGLELLLLGGSLPSGFRPRDLVHLMKLAKSRGVETIVDCPGEILSRVLSAHPLLIKPNLEEFHNLSGSHVSSVEAVYKKAERYLDKVFYICISSVEGGALLVTRTGAVWGCIPRVEIHSTVGAGDSMVGAMAAQIYDGIQDPEQILRRGLAAAAATLMEHGTGLGSARNISALFKKIVIKKIR